MTLRSRFGLALAALLLLIPLAAGATYAALHQWTPAHAWSAADAGGPQQDGPVTAADLVDARRAVGEAVSQAGLLNNATGQLKQGTGDLAEGAKPLADGMGQAAAGSQELVNGLVELQAGTGQLGDGATKIADGVGAAVDNIVGVNAVRGQLITAIDSSLKELEGVKTPEAAKVRGQLNDLKSQANNFQLDPALTGQLNELKQGSRDLANQLDVSGYAYHDGIYAATEGAKELNAALQQLDGGVDEALKGVDDLNKGAGQIDTMAKNAKEKAQAAQRSLPVVQEEAAPVRALSPLLAVVVGALALLAGIAMAGRRWWAVALGVVGSAAAGVIALAVLATGFTPGAAAWSAGLLALTALAAYVGTVLAVRIFGTVAGNVVAAAVGMAQLGAVGLLWKQVASAGDAVPFLAHLLPLQWSTTGLTAAGNGAASELLWMPLAVLAGVCALGWACELAAKRMKMRGNEAAA